MHSSALSQSSSSQRTSPDYGRRPPRSRLPAEPSGCDGRPSRHSETSPRRIRRTHRARTPGTSRRPYARPLSCNARRRKSQRKRLTTPFVNVPTERPATPLATSQSSDRAARQSPRMTAFSRSDHPAYLRGTTAFDGKHSSDGARRRDAFAQTKERGRRRRGRCFGGRVSFGPLALSGEPAHAPRFRIRVKRAAVRGCSGRPAGRKAAVLAATASQLLWATRRHARRRPPQVLESGPFASELGAATATGVESGSEGTRQPPRLAQTSSGARVPGRCSSAPIAAAPSAPSETPRRSRVLAARLLTRRIGARHARRRIQGPGRCLRNRPCAYAQPDPGGPGLRSSRPLRRCLVPAIDMSPKRSSAMGSSGRLLLRNAIVGRQAGFRRTAR
jgi:hypothetical protein